MNEPLPFVGVPYVQSPPELPPLLLVLDAPLELLLLDEVPLEERPPDEAPLDELLPAPPLLVLP